MVIMTRPSRLGVQVGTQKKGGARERRIKLAKPVPLPLQIVAIHRVCEFEIVSCASRGCTLSASSTGTLSGRAGARALISVMHVSRTVQ